jgi:hypothetical protein
MKPTHLQQIRVRRYVAVWLMAAICQAGTALRGGIGNEGRHLLFVSAVSGAEAPAKEAGVNGMADASRTSSVIVSEQSEVDVAPDGDLSKKFWSAAKRVRFDQTAFSRKSYLEAETAVASRWTKKYLYLAFWCHYERLNIYEGEDPGLERWRLWEKDVVEAFINPKPEKSSHYYEFEIAPNNQWLDLEIDLKRKPFNDAKWNSGFEHATRIYSARHIWTAEMRIPVLAMKVAGLHPDTEWRINFYRADGPETNGSGTSNARPDNSRRMLSWGALPLNLPENSFHQAASFGVLRFTAFPASRGPGELHIDANTARAET